MKDMIFLIVVFFALCFVSSFVAIHHNYNSLKSSTRYSESYHRDRYLFWMKCVSFFLFASIGTMAMFVIFSLLKIFEV